MNNLIEYVKHSETVIAIIMVLQLVAVTIFGVAIGFPRTGAITSVVLYFVIFIIPAYRKHEKYRKRFPVAVLGGCVVGGIISFLCWRNPDEFCFYLILFFSLFNFCILYFDLEGPDD